MNKAKANSMIAIIMKPILEAFGVKKSVEAPHHWALIPVKVQNLPGNK